MESDWRRRINTPEEYLETERLLLRARESEFIMTPEYTKNSKARFYRELALDYYQTVSSLLYMLLVFIFFVSFIVLVELDHALSSHFV